MIQKSLIILPIILCLCVACQSVEPMTTPTIISTQAISLLPTSTAIMTGTPTPTKIATPPETSVPEREIKTIGDGLVAFYSDRDGSPEIYTIKADGSGLVRLTNDPTFDDSPAISPDGRQIVFLTARHDPKPQFPNLKYEIYLMDIDGGNPRRLTNTEAAEDHPAWSPDGSKILFDADYDGDGFYEIYTLNPDGTELTRLTFNTANDQFADWSPDGSQIAFSSDRNGSWDLFIMDADGGNQEALTDSPDWELFPAWSPDGGQIAFNGLVPRSRNTDIFVMNADGSEIRQLTDAPGFDENPVWSPDGGQIAFQTQRDGHFEIYVMNPDGSAQQPLAAHSANELWPSWGLATSASGAQADSWLPELPDELCVPTETRSCQVLFVLPAQYYAESGMGFPDQFRDLGYTVTIASDAPEVVEVCANTVGFDQPSKNFPVDLSLSEVEVENYDTVIFIGGLGCQDQWQDQNAHRIAQDAVEQKVVLGASGCASTILAYAGVLQSKTASVCSDNPPVKHGMDYCEVLQSLGAMCSQEPITRAGLVITAQQNSPYFVAGIIQVISETSLSGPLLSMQKSAQELGMRETFQAALGDLDGDGDLDAVFANPMSNAAAVWLNDGRGIFVDTGQQLTEYGHGVGLADFDGDGDLDTFIVCHQSALPSKVYLNDGTGVFSDSGQEFGDARFSAADLNLLDINGDGHTDAQVLYYSSSGVPDKVYLNDGAGNFTDSGLALDEDFIAWGDLDGDGDMDYFGKHWGQGYVVMLNNGNGQFSADWQTEDSLATVGEVVLADFDADGDLDALIANGFRDTGSQPSRLLWNDGRGQFSESGVILPETMGAGFAVGDLDLDGDLDVFVTNMDRQNQIWLYEAGQFLDSGLRLGEDSEMSGRPSLGDLDGDGDLDVIVGRFRGGAEIWFNQTK